MRPQGSTQGGGAGNTYAKAKKGIEENILKPGFSINPGTVLAGRQKLQSSPAEPEQGPMVEEDPAIQNEVQEQTLLDFDTLKASLIEQYRSQNRTYMATWLGMLGYNEAARTLDITVDAKAQETEISGEKPAILYHFRHGMGIPELQLNLTLREVQKSEAAAKKIYTAKEKFEHMVSKNPNLGILRETFGLEIDF